MSIYSVDILSVFLLVGLQPLSGLGLHLGVLLRHGANGDCICPPITSTWSATQTSGPPSMVNLQINSNSTYNKITCKILMVHWCSHQLILLLLLVKFTFLQTMMLYTKLGLGWLKDVHSIFIEGQPTHQLSLDWSLPPLGFLLPNVGFAPKPEDYFSHIVFSRTFWSS